MSNPISMTGIQVTVEPPRRDKNGYPISAGTVRNGRLMVNAIDKWGWADESGKIPEGREGMNREEFEHFSASVLAAFDVYEAAAQAKERLLDELEASVEALK